MASDINIERGQLLALRRAIATTIEGLRDVADSLLAAVDAVDGDRVLEEDDPDGGNIEDEPQRDNGEDDAELGWANEGSQARLHADGSGLDREPTLGARECFSGTNHLWGWKGPTAVALDELEDENEHGGDILDEPHDKDPREDTALERAGAGFFASGGDDAEEDDDPGGCEPKVAV